MKTIWKQRLAHTEYALFGALAVVLPILESPKNLILFLLLLLSVIRVVGGDFTWRRPDRVETSLLFILAVSILSTAINWPLVNGLKGLKDTLSQVLVFWLIYRAGYSGRQRHGLAALVAVGVVFGLGWGIVHVLQSGPRQLQFHSAGTVTQSSMYLGIALIATFAVAWMGTGRSTELRAKAVNSLWWMATAIMMIGLFLMASRGAIVAVLIAVLVLMVAARERRLWVVMTGLLTAALVLAVWLPDRFDQHRSLVKTRESITTGAFVEADQGRYDNWRIAMRRISQGDSLLLGIGPRNFAAIDHTKMQFDPPLTIKPGRLNHAHNIFLNKLVEEGIVGLATLLFFFGLVIARLVQDYRAGAWRNWPWFAAVGAVIVPSIAGSFNTPWQQEHALLAMLWLALYMAARRPDVGARATAP